MKRFVFLCIIMVLMLPLSACGHTHTWIEASCTQAKKCSECGKQEGEPIGHALIKATCTEPKICLICGEQEGNPKGHIWAGATCTEPKTCITCGETEGESAGHSVREWILKTEPTCAIEGEEQGDCKKCGNTFQRPVAKLEHILGEWIVTKNATSSSAGQKTQSCTVCGEVVGTEKFHLSAEEIEAEYKASCTAYDFETIARDPDKYKYTNGKYTGEIIQVLEDGNELQLRVNITKGRYSYTDTIYVMYTKKDGESRLLEDDIVTLYGMNMGTVSYVSVLGSTVTLPCVYAEYIELN